MYFISMPSLDYNLGGMANVAEIPEKNDHNRIVEFISADHVTFKDPRNISVSLHRRVGRFVKLELYFASKWILISEVCVSLY